MFDDNPKDLTAWLAEAERRSRIRTNFDQGEARKKLATWIRQDSRFGEFDASKLAERVVDCIGHGATLDLDDPVLKGRERRPLDRRTG